jgi:hypothetical protein
MANLRRLAPCEVCAIPGFTEIPAVDPVLSVVSRAFCRHRVGHSGWSEAGILPNSEPGRPSTDLAARSPPRGEHRHPRIAHVPPIDFETQTLAGGLRQAGFKAHEPAFFLDAGAIVYLTRATTMSTLKFVASLPAGTEIVFDYAISPSVLSESDRRGHDDTSRVVAARGGL